MLKVTNLCKQYGENISVDNISFDIAHGEVVGLLGPNGAGKSTTMKMLTGLIHPTSGRIILAGCDMDADDLISAKAQLGYLPETPPLYLDMTAEEQLRFVCEVKGVSGAAVAQEIDRVCGLVSITDMKRRIMGSLSKGYRQRVGIAQALVGSPSLLVLDEPTVGLDPQQIIDIRELITRLSGSLTIIISSHILSEIASVCSRIIIMKKGRIVADGTPDALEREHGDKNRLLLTVSGDGKAEAGSIERIQGVALVQVGLSVDKGASDITVECESGCERREEIFRAVVDAGGVILLMKRIDAGLEQIFIELTA